MIRRAGSPALTAFGAVAALALSACGADAPERVAGECTVREPGAAATAGPAAYAEHVTPTLGGRFEVGSLAVTITCRTGGSLPDQVVLVLPNLVSGTPPAPGEYRIRDPGEPSLSPAERTDPRLAWARVRRGGPERPILFAGVAGQIVLTRADGGVLEGAYQVALGVADTAVSLTGARPEVEGPVGADLLGRPVFGRTILGGAFIAVRGEADWRGR
jgi:hypothetical protein